MRRLAFMAAAGIGLAAATYTPAAAQTWADDDAVLRQIWQHGMADSHVMRLAQVLTDSIGPRLAGTPQYTASVEWAVGMLRGWGVDARAEQYGTWRGWERGVTHIDLVQPRVRTLEGTMLAHSPGTNGAPLEAAVIAMPPFESAAAFEAWLPTVSGRFVAISSPQPTCRPVSHFEQFGQQGAAERMATARRDAAQRFEANRPGTQDLRLRLEQAGAAGILESYWSNDLGVNKVFATNTTRIPTVDLSCEDYGLVYRLAANGQSPVVRLNAQSRNLGEVPQHNVIGTIRGRERPDEYVLLSAHLDSWDAASGATDNATGTAVMLEAMRILSRVQPQPKRTILVGLWGGEEQGLNGSRRFVEMNPAVVKGLHAGFNQDNGTGRIVNISYQGFTQVAPAFDGWLARVPREITQHINIQNPGFPSTGGTDHASFVCAGAPAFSLGSNSWSYGTVTWHTNRDTYDKIVAEEIRNNATLVAMLVYLASEHPEKLSRVRRDMGELSWPQCQPGAARSPQAGTRR